MVEGVKVASSALTVLPFWVSKSRAVASLFTPQRSGFGVLF